MLSSCFIYFSLLFPRLSMSSNSISSSYAELSSKDYARDAVSCSDAFSLYSAVTFFDSEFEDEYALIYSISPFMYP